MSNKKLYTVLGVDENADDKQIRTAWKKLTMKYHPDRLQSCTETEKKIGQDKIKEINAAYEVLGDVDKKAKYDKLGDKWLKGEVPDFEDMDHFGNMGGFGSFGNMFGHGFQQQKRGPNVQPIQELLEVTLLDLFYGKYIEKEINRILLCIQCDGTGSADKKLPVCGTCRGSGHVMKTVQIGPGMLSQTQAVCHTCRGTGKSSSNIVKCTKCNGIPQTNEKTKIKVNVEPGMSNKKVITMNNIGNEYVQSGKILKGPVMFILQEKEHPVFKRGFVINNKQNMANLLITIDINFVESLCGFSKEIKYIDDTVLYLYETDVIKDGEVKKIPNKGMPYESNKYKTGDLFVKYNVKIPNDLPMETKNKIAELFKYDGIATPSEGVMEVSTVKFNGDNTHDAYDSDDEPEHPEAGRGVQCAHF